MESNNSQHPDCIIVDDPQPPYYKAPDQLLKLAMWFERMKLANWAKEQIRNRPQKKQC
jgi:hypothetical protein